MNWKTVLALFGLFLLQSCQKELTLPPVAAPSFLQIRFVHKAGDASLQTGATYTNSFGEDFTVNKFKYYISNITLLSDKAEQLIPDSYFLVDEGVAASKTIRVPIAPGSCENVELLLGVDSTRNVSGAQTGALDPVNDMFWSWNTGYIMFKLEGSAPLSVAPNNRLQYHIGGFAGPSSSLRQLDVGFFAPMEIKAGQTLYLDFTADLLRWFDGVHPLPIRSHAVSMTPGALSSQYADNVQSMFDVTRATVQ